MSLKYDLFCVDNYEFDTLPYEFAIQASAADVGTVERTIGNNISQISYTSPVHEERKTVRQKWKIAFDGMSFELFNKVKELYASNASFQLRFDNKLSRSICKLETNDPDRKLFVTPTWPIIGYGYDIADSTHDDNIFVMNTLTNVVTQLTTAPTVTNDVGVIEFPDSLASYTEVFMRYVSIPYVRINMCELNPRILAQNIYHGYLELEQVIDSGIIATQETDTHIQMTTYSTSTLPTVGY